MSEEKFDTKYIEKYNSFIKYIPYNNYFFEVTKLCNYSEFLMINKKSTLLDLYKSVSIQFECENINRLFIKDENAYEEILIPKTNINISDNINKKLSGYKQQDKKTTII